MMDLAALFKEEGIESWSSCIEVNPLQDNLCTSVRNALHYLGTFCLPPLDNKPVDCGSVFNQQI